jgi:hypothetical protein
MRPVALVVVLCAAAVVALRLVLPAGAQGGGEFARALAAWTRYAECEKTRRFAPCYELLSRSARRAWAEQARATAEAWAAGREAEEVQYTSLTVVRTRRSPARIVVVVRAEGRRPDGPFSRSHEYAFVKEDGEWRVDSKREGLSQALP